jgi:hypothetical protein
VEIFGFRAWERYLSTGINDTLHKRVAILRYSLSVQLTFRETVKANSADEEFLSPY